MHSSPLHCTPLRRCDHQLCTSHSTVSLGTSAFVTWITKTDEVGSSPPKYALFIVKLNVSPIDSPVPSTPRTEQSDPTEMLPLPATVYAIIGHGDADVSYLTSVNVLPPLDVYCGTSTVSVKRWFRAMVDPDASVIWSTMS